MRYLSMIFAVCVAVLVVGCSEDAPNTLHRTDTEMKQIEGRLSSVKVGDLIVMVDAGGKTFPDIDKVLNPPSDGRIMKVNEVHYNGVHENRMRDVLTSFYGDYHKSRGTVLIIPKEKVPDFYGSIADKAMLYGTY